MMVAETQIQQVEEMVGRLLKGDPEYFLVAVKIMPIQQVKVYMDGDSGISIGQCARYNRLLYKELEESKLFPDGNFSLEVSSPGLDEPLKLLRQYQKNRGRRLELVLKTGETHSGKILEVTEEGLLLEEIKGKNKKKESVQNHFSFNNIKIAKIQVEI